MSIEFTGATANLAYLQACVPAWAKLTLTGPQLRVLLLAAAGEGASHKSIQDVTGMLPSTLSRVVDHLVEDGLVERYEDRRDRRLVICRPTAAGRDLVLRLLPPPGTCETAPERTSAP